MTDAPSHHDEWYQADDVLSSDHPTPPPAVAPLAGPTLAPATVDEPSLGLRGLVGAAVSTQEPSLGFGGLSASDAPTVEPEVQEPVTARVERLAAAVSAVPIERVAPLTAIGFVCSLLVWAIVQVLF